MYNLSKSKKINFAKLYQGGIHLIDHLPLVKKRRRRKRALKAIKLTSYVLVIFSLIIIIFFATIFYSGMQIYNLANSAKLDLAEAYNYFSIQEYKTANIYAQKAENKLNFALEQISQVRESNLIALINYHAQIENIEYLINSAKYISRTLGDASKLANNFDFILSKSNNSPFNAFTREEKRKILKQIYEIEPELKGLKASIDLAIVNLNNIKTNSLLLLPLTSTINNIHFQLVQSQIILSDVIPTVDSLPKLLGYPQKARYFVVFQNNDELHATGGKINVVGILDIDSGDITNFFTYPANLFENFVSQNLLQLKFSEGSLQKNNMNIDEINNQPDWPTTARDLDSLYSNLIKTLENNAPILIAEPSLTKILPAQPLVGVVGVTPDFFSGLIEQVGEINYSNHSYKRQAFINLIKQNEKEVAYPEDILLVGELLKDLQIKLLNLPINEWNKVVSIVIDNLRQKNILLYFNDNEIQNKFEMLGYTGSVSQQLSDYLMVIDSYINSENNDAAISRSLNYKIEQGSNGLFSQLDLYYANNNILNDVPTLPDKYKSYTRIYIPLGSQLVQSQGVELNKIEITEELNKTVFAIPIDVEASDIKKLTLTYKLPEKLNSSISANGYSLLVQKQPGKNIKELLVDVKFLDDIKTYSPTGFYVLKTDRNNAIWKTDLDMDKSFFVEF